MEAKQTGKFRIVIEWSSMANNDETVRHIDKYITREEFHEHKELHRGKMYGEQPELVFCRPVFEHEMAAGLNVNYAGSAYDEKPPHPTEVLDQFYNLVSGILWRKQAFLKNVTPVHIIEDYISQHYYDCMSGGMPKYAIAACRFLLKQYNYDPNMLVYPSGDDPKYRGSGIDPETKTPWYTLGDFMRDTIKYDLLEKEIAGLATPLLLGPVL